MVSTSFVEYWDIFLLVNINHFYLSTDFNNLDVDVMSVLKTHVRMYEYYIIILFMRMW